MKRLQSFLLTTLMISVLASRGNSQEFMTSHLVGGEVWSKNSYTVGASVGWKHIYQYPGWRRASASVNIAYKYDLWRVQLGVDDYYTFDNEIANTNELRPWLRVNLHVPIVNRVKFWQYLQQEFRYFQYQSDKNSESKWRTRLRGVVQIELSRRKPDDERMWELDLGAEWYFMKDQISGERFANSQELTARLTRKFRRGNSISLNYGFEVYTDKFGSSDDDAHTVGLVYWF